MITKVRAVQLTFENGLTVIGLVPAGVNDAEFTAIRNGRITVALSDAAEVPRSASIGTTLARLTAAQLLDLRH